MGPEAQAVFAELYKREYQAISRAVFLVVGDVDVAHEIAQEAFIRLFVSWRRVSAYDRPGAWVRRVAIRLAITASKRAGRGRAVARSSSQTESVPDTTNLSAAEVDLVRAIRQLPLNQRVAVVLTYVEDAPASVIADVLACDESTARVHLHRARRRLGELLHEEVSDGVG